MLRVAKPGGLPQATALRAQYSQVLAKAGQVELVAWAQQAIDLADVVLMDAVIRENDNRPKTDRAFLSPGVLELFGNVWEEYRLAQAVLEEVITTAKRGGLIYAQFEKGHGAVAVNRIALGLRVAQHDYDLDEDGGIIIKPADNNDRLDTVGVKLRQMTKK